MRRRNTCSSCRRNGNLRVPEAWVTALHSAYVKNKPKQNVYVKVHDLVYATPGSRIEKGLLKLYPSGTIKLRIRVKALPPGVGGSTPYPKPGGTVEMTIRPGMKRGKSVIRHEMRHVVQHLGDMALRATMTAKDKARVKAGTKGKLAGRFGRPSPKTVKALRGWKADVKKKGKQVSGAAWYYRSPSEYLPHTGDAAGAVIRKLPADPTDKEVRARIRHVLKTRPIFQHLSRAERRDAISALYAEVRDTLDAA